MITRSGRWRVVPAEQDGWCDLQNVGYLEDLVEGGAVRTCLDAADRLAVDASELGESLLRKACLFAEVAKPVAEAPPLLGETGRERRRLHTLKVVQRRSKVCTKFGTKQRDGNLNGPANTWQWRDTERMTRPITPRVPRPRPRRPGQSHLVGLPTAYDIEPDTALQMEIDAAVTAVRLTTCLPVSGPQRWAVHVTLGAMLVALALDGDIRPGEITLGALADACATPAVSAARRIDGAFTGRPGYPAGAWVIALFGLDPAARLLSGLVAEHGPATPVHQLTAQRGHPIDSRAHGATALDPRETAL